MTCRGRGAQDSGRAFDHPRPESFALLEQIVRLRSAVGGRGV